jgi:NADPH-dependent 2,4-dienoyl-CoA reductase/sulfur reductase-like enzyme
LIAAKAPGRDAFEDQVYFEENEMVRVGVEVRLENQADAASIKALSPEAIVIATGALPRVPHDVSGLELPHVVYGWDVMKGVASCGQRVALVSQEDYYETASVADYLASKGREVTVFHKSAHIGREIARYSQGMVLARMEELGVVTVPNVILRQIDAEGLEFDSAFGGKTVRHEGFDSVVLVYGAVAQSELYDQLKAEGFPQLYLAGAAWLPRRMAEATRHGANIGLII